RDPRHSSRQEALRYFGQDDSWVILCWIWIEKFKMSVPDATMFLGGRDSDVFRQFLIWCLDKDNTKALEAFNNFNASRNVIDEKSVLAACLYNRLRPLSPPHEEPDLMPAGATSIRQAVLAKLKSLRK